MNNIVVKLFGPVRDVVGAEELRIDLPASATGEAVFNQLCSRHPELLPWRSAVRLAVNLEYVQFDHHIHGGDEVCIIPPVSGG